MALMVRPSSLHDFLFLSLYIFVGFTQPRHKLTQTSIAILPTEYLNNNVLSLSNIAQSTLKTSQPFVVTFCQSNT